MTVMTYLLICGFGACQLGLALYGVFFLAARDLGIKLGVLDAR